MTKMMDTYRIANAFQQAAVGCMSRFFAETFARNAIEGNREACKELVVNYAHVYREQPKAVLIAISVMVMDPADYSYADYDKIKRTIVEMMEETR